MAACAGVDIVNVQRGGFQGGGRTGVSIFRGGHKGGLVFQTGWLGFLERVACISYRVAYIFNGVACSFDGVAWFF